MSNVKKDIRAEPGAEEREKTRRSRGAGENCCFRPFLSRFEQREYAQSIQRKQIYRLVKFQGKRILARVRMFIVDVYHIR